MSNVPASSDGFRFYTVQLPQEMTGQQVIDFVKAQTSENYFLNFKVSEGLSDGPADSSFRNVILEGFDGYSAIIGSQEGESHVFSIDLAQIYQQVNLYPTFSTTAFMPAQPPTAESAERQLGFFHAILTNTVQDYLLSKLKPLAGGFVVVKSDHTFEDFGFYGSNFSGNSDE